MFNISETASLWAESWASWNLEGVFSTESDILPFNECPVTHYTVCLLANCSDSSPPLNFKVEGSLLKLDLKIPVPKTKYYLKPITSSENFLIVPINVLVCGFEKVKTLNSSSF